MISIETWIGRRGNSGNKQISIYSRGTIVFKLLGRDWLMILVLRLILRSLRLD
jgi:hypothetical protein